MVLVCPLLIWTCLCGSGFFAKVLRVPGVSWNSSHVAVLPNSGKKMLPLLTIPGKKEIKDFFFFLMPEQLALFSEQQPSCLCSFLKNVLNVTVLSHFSSGLRM